MPPFSARFHKDKRSGESLPRGSFSAPRPLHGERRGTLKRGKRECASVLLGKGLSASGWRKSFKRSAASGACRTSANSGVQRFRKYGLVGVAKGRSSPAAEKAAEGTGAGVGVGGRPQKGQATGRGQQRRRPRKVVPKAERQSSLVACDIASLVGRADETEAEHLRRHPRKDIEAWSQRCPRCFYIRWPGKRPAWIATKPRWVSGAWGIGCRLCAAGRYSEEVTRRRSALCQEYRKQSICKQASSRFSKWSQYNVNRILSGRSFLDAIAKHEASDLHKITHAVFHSMSAHLGQRASAPQPLASTQLVAQSTARGVDEVSDTVRSEGGSASLCSSEPVSQLGTTGAVTDPFRGRVPQVRDWLEAWADATSFVSTRKQVGLDAKKLMVKPGRSRTSRRRMIRILAAVARERLCQRLREAESTTEALDDCKGRKIVRIRCDTPGPPYCYNGVLGIATKTYCDAASGAEDHAERTIKGVSALHRRVFVQHTQKERKKASKREGAGFQNDKHTKKRTVELSTVCDDESLLSFRDKVRILASDGGSGERRAVFLPPRNIFRGYR